MPLFVLIPAPTQKTTFSGAVVRMYLKSENVRLKEAGRKRYAETGELEIWI
jgi:hypothetical protein